jgi:hypothetical protein
MTSFSKGQKGGSKAWAISDRSGTRFPMHEMVKEPGTGYLVHQSESDGIWNFVDHPQAHINEYATFGDPFPVADARPDIVWAATTSTVLTDQNGNPLYAGYVYFDVLNPNLINDWYPTPGKE